MILVAPTPCCTLRRLSHTKNRSQNLECIFEGSALREIFLFLLGLGCLVWNETLARADDTSVWLTPSVTLGIGRDSNYQFSDTNSVSAYTPLAAVGVAATSSAGNWPRTSARTAMPSLP